MALWTLSGTTRVSRYHKVHFAIFWIFWSKVKITQADTPTIWMDCCPIQTNWCPISAVTSFLCRMPFLTQPSQFILAWDRHQICWIAYLVAGFCSTHTVEMKWVSGGELRFVTCELFKMTLVVS